ncbi:MAG: ComF family protein [Alphaproteobacteria bacterium]|nr:MAG: ComF family protein [Alphaproteobacteria bacterium]
MKNSILQIFGNWDAGYALDKHKISSTYIGENEYGHPQFDTLRTEVGEALFRLKYRDDFSKAEPLAAEIEQHLVPKFGKIGFIVPMPASKQRPRQPVTEIAKALAQRLEVPIFENIVVKLPAPDGAPALKDLVGKQAKVDALSDRFAINDGITNDGKWNVLVVDDLYDTGASMEAACAKLRTYHKVDKIFVAALTWK